MVKILGIELSTGFCCKDHSVIGCHFVVSHQLSESKHIGFMKNMGIQISYLRSPAAQWLLIISMTNPWHIKFRSVETPSDGDFTMAKNLGIGRPLGNHKALNWLYNGVIMG